MSCAARRCGVVMLLASAALLRTARPASAAGPEGAAAVDPDLRTSFRVKYVAEGVAYLDGGRGAGLAEGMRLLVRDGGAPVAAGGGVDEADPRVVAELVISAVAESSAVADVRSRTRAPVVGDIACLTAAEASQLVEQRTAGPGRRYPAVVTFSEGDPLDEEMREEVPRPPLPSVNRFRVRIGLDYMATAGRGDSAMDGSGLGLVLRPDITRIGGTYWNLNGYWRARDDSGSSSGQKTLQELMSRTYHFGMTYDNPNARWVAGLGRLYVPWAQSVDTIDGGYAGRRLGAYVTVGVFAGSTPDPTSWSYDPDRRLAGAFLAFERGSFEALRYAGTAGVGVSTKDWRVERPFVFFENALLYKRVFSIYDTLHVDGASAGDAASDAGGGVSRHFLTVRFQPSPRLELSLNHNYFRDIPEIDPQFLGTGMLDRYLFQGSSLGTRVEVIPGLWVSGAIGKSDRTGDASSSWNQSLGVTWGRVPWLGLRADARAARFASPLGDGSYQSLSLSRNVTDAFRLELLAGSQSFASLTGADRATFLTASADVTLGSRYFVQGSYTASRGPFSYDQWSVTLGYIFDSKARRP